MAAQQVASRRIARAASRRTVRPLHAAGGRGRRLGLPDPYHRGPGRDLLAADGWHFKYGTHARARLVAYLGPSYKDRRILADFPDEYTLNRIEVVPPNKDEPPRILVSGTQNTYVLHSDAMGWQARNIATSSEVERATVWSAGDLRYALISGDPARVVALER